MGLRMNQELTFSKAPVNF